MKIDERNAPESDLFDSFFDSDLGDAEDTIPAESEQNEIDEDTVVTDAPDGEDAEEVYLPENNTEQTDNDETDEAVELESESHHSSLPPVLSKYNGNTISVDARAAQSVAQAYGMDTDTLVRTIQKGLNYAKLDGQMQVLRDYAAFNGVTVAEVTKQLSDGLPNMAYTSALEALNKQYPGSDPALLESMARQQANEKMRGIKEKSQIMAKEESADSEDSDPYADAKRQWREFAEWKSDIKSLNDIPREVRDEVFSKGIHPIRAYLQYENQRLAAENARLAKEAKTASVNRRNKVRSTGPMGGSSGDSVGLFDKFFD